MTEVTDETDGPRFWSLPPVAFYVALLATPLLIALLGLALVGVLVGAFLMFSVPFGGLSYLLVGAPLFWRSVLMGRISLVAFAAAGFLANMIAAVLAVPAIAMVTGSIAEAAQASLFVHGFGLVFSPLYGLVFGLIFRGLVDPDALPPAPPARLRLPELPTLEQEIGHDLRTV